jgi:hypothetical protein
MRPDGLSSIDKIDGNSVYPSFDIITLPDYFFILAARRVYRFYGFRGTSAGVDSLKNEGPVLRLLQKLPGFDFESGSASPLIFSPSIKYKYIFGQDEKPAIIRNIE